MWTSKGACLVPAQFVEPGSALPHGVVLVHEASHPVVQIHGYPMVLPCAVVLANSNLNLPHVHFMRHVARAQVGGQHVLQLVLALIVAAAVHDGCLQPASTAGASAVHTC